MNTISYLKLAIVGIAVIGVFTLAGLGKITAPEAITGCTTLVGALVVALGIQGGANALAGRLPPKDNIVTKDPGAS